MSDVTMRIPFHQTLRQANKLGFVKTVSLLIAVSLKSLKRIKYLPEKAIINVNNSKMLVLPKKGAIHSELFLYKKREPICTDYLIHSGVIRKNDVVLDVRANIGYYVLVESQLTGNCGKVFAVEPVINNFKLLKKNVKLNNLKNVQSFQLAFGEEDSKSKIYVSDRANLCAMKRSAVGGKIIDVQEVSMLTVDAFFRGRVPKLYPNGRRRLRI